MCFYGGFSVGGFCVFDCCFRCIFLLGVLFVISWFWWGFCVWVCCWLLCLGLFCGVLFGGIWCCGFGWFVNGLGAVYLCGLGVVVGCCLSDLFVSGCFCEWCFNSVVLFLFV